MSGCRTRARDVAVFATAGFCAVALALTACTTVPTAPVAELPDAELPDGISVRIFQSRFDYASHTLKLSVTNESDADFDLRDAAFSSPQFAGHARYSDDLVLSPGMTRDLPVVVPAPACDSGADANSPSATVVLGWQDVDGHAQQGTVTPTDDTDALARIFAEDCLAESVRTLASISTSDRLRIDAGGAPPTAWVDITITPTGAAGTLSVSQVRGTVLLAPTTAETWPVGAALTADSAALTLAIDLRPTRCDPHAIAEDKRGTVFQLEVVASGADGESRAGTIDVPVTDQVRSEIYDWIGQYCAP